MILYTPPTASAPHMLVVGVGLIGTAVSKRIEKHFPLHAKTTFSLQWDDSSQLSSQWREALSRVTPGQPLHVVWCAGKAGFSADNDTLKQEDARFAIFLELLGELPQRSVFHYMSSGGGIFEGAGLIKADTTPAPLRPYGESKLRQEAMLSECAALSHVVFYRPSSVCGYYHSVHRKGLVSVLVRNAILQQTTMLTGSSSTLRDFIWVDDIARFVVNKILCLPLERASTCLLAAAKPTSIYEVRDLVQRAAGRPSYFAFARSFTNNKNITYHRNAIAPGFQATSLLCVVREVHRKLLEEVVR